MNDIDTQPLPAGDLTLRSPVLPRDTNANGDISGGWLLSQMDMAGSIAADRLARGRVATVAISQMAFLTPVHVGDVLSCYCDVVETGSSSMRMVVEVWIEAERHDEPTKVTEGEFVFVAIDENGRTRAIR